MALRTTTSGETSALMEDTSNQSQISLKDKIFHANIQIDSVEDRPGDSDAAAQSYRLIEESKEDPEDAAAQHKSAQMQVWWEESIAKHMDLNDGYEKVSVLLIKWDDGLDELKTREEAEELRDLFAHQFRYECEVVELNVQTKPQHQITQYLTTFINKYDGQNHLMIVYYTGHGIYREDKKFLELTASENPSIQRGLRKQARANWSRAEEYLHSDDIEGDVLTILDTCYSSNLQKTGKEDTRTFELLSACTIDNTTAAPGPNSFTRALIDALKELLKELVEDNKEGSFTTFHLNQRINQNPARHDTQSQLWFRLKHHDRHIRLAPLKRPREAVNRISLPKPPRGYLTLRFALRDDTLNREQIDYLANILSKAFKNKKSLVLRKIDWLGLKPARTTEFGRTALAMFAVTQWRKFVNKKREDRMRLDGAIGIAIPSEPATTQSTPSSPRKRAREFDDSLPEAKKGLLDLPPKRQSPPSPPISDSSRFEDARDEDAHLSG